MNSKIILFKQYLEEGYTQQKSAIMADINPKNASKIVDKYDLIVNKKYGLYRHNDNYFDIIDTENKAYLLGFFLADGYIENNRIRIQNSIDDFESIELFRKELSPESKICYGNKQTCAKFRKEQITVGLTSKHMSNKLRDKYDIIQNKTKHDKFKFDFNTIPIELHKDFIRGFFDGDGSVSFYKTNNTIFFNFSFIFNSKYFTEQIADIFKDLFQIKPIIREIKGKTCNYFTLRFNYNRNRVNKIKEIYNYFYNESNVYLSRKKIKFEQYMEYRAKDTDNIVSQCNA